MQGDLLRFLALALGTLALGTAAGRLSGWLADRPWGVEGLGRKFFHIAVFTGAVPAQLFLGFWGVVLYGALMAGLIVQGTLRPGGSTFRRAMGREGEGDSRTILLPLGATALGGVLSALLVGSFATVGYLVCGWGDAAGELAGRRWGRRSYASPFSGKVPVRRTIEGSAFVAGFGFLGAAAALCLLGYGFRAAVGVGFLAGLGGAVGEGMSGRNADNLWAQLVPSLLSWWFLG